jgi:3-hexulose-6-phosphate synthase
MKLQVAMDVLTVDAALELAGKVAEYVDIIELGTPLVKNAGLTAVTAVKTAHPDKIVFADMKTMDAGELEAGIAFSAGADLVSVLGSADDSTIAGAVKAAKAHNKGVVVDLIGVEDKVTGNLRRRPAPLVRGAVVRQPASIRCLAVSDPRIRSRSASQE